MIGLIGEKIGMTQIFKEDGVVVPVTVLRIPENTVLRKKSIESDGYNAVLLGAFSKKESRLNYPERGFFKVSPSKIEEGVFEEDILSKLDRDDDKTFLNEVYKKNKHDYYILKKNLTAKKKSVLFKILSSVKLGAAPVKVLKEFRSDNVDKYNEGLNLGVSELEKVEFVDVIGKSKGKGFQGVIKRHGFGGGRKTHGSKFHRQNGSTGHSAYPSRVFKGLKRAGRMGFDRVTTQSLKVVKIDLEKGLVMLKGSVPGSKKSVVFIRKAKKK